jgi:hypothetical protein
VLDRCVVCEHLHSIDRDAVREAELDRRDRPRSGRTRRSSTRTFATRARAAPRASTRGPERKAPSAFTRAVSTWSAPMPRGAAAFALVGGLVVTGAAPSGEVLRVDEQRARSPTGSFVAAVVLGVSFGSCHHFTASDGGDGGLGAGVSGHLCATLSPTRDLLRRLRYARSAHGSLGRRRADRRALRPFAW